VYCCFYQERDTYAAMVEQLGGKVVEGQQYDHSCTHLVISKYPCTHLVISKYSCTQPVISKY